MELTITTTSLIYPSPTPISPPPFLPLSHLDTDTNLLVTFRTLRLFPSSPTPLNLATLIASALPAALSLFFPFSYPLGRNPSYNRLHVDTTKGPTGVPFTQATTKIQLVKLNATPGSPELDLLAPNLANGDELDHPLAFQVTSFACGGFALGMCAHHALCDGAGATLFLNCLASLARRGVEPAVRPVWNRSGLLGPRNPARVEVGLFDDIIQFDGDVVYHGPYDLVQKTRGGSIIKECFHVRDVSLDRLRNRLSEQTGSRFTSFEALCAFIWRARVKATGIPGTEVVKLVYSMNISKHVKPELPAGYWGNVCVPVYAKLTAGELIEQPLSETAKLIKKSKQAVNDEYVRSYIDFLELNYSKGITAGTRVSAFTDWRHLGHSGVDFGTGSPAVVMPLSWRILGSVEPCFLLPYGAGDRRSEDGFMVLVCLQENASKEFRDEMEKLSCEDVGQVNSRELDGERVISSSM